jgi:hypothetical protein
MPFNGSGVFVRLYNWVSDQLNGIDILASRMDGEMQGMADGLSQCITRDGQSPPTADLPMAGHRFTNLGTPIAAADAATKGYVDGGISQFSSAIPSRLTRGAFALPATIRYFGDSFFAEPYSHSSSGHGMAYKSAVSLGVASSINATSGNTSADKQDAIFAFTPSASDITVLGLGQNDAQFIGTNSDVEMRLNDVSLIHLANQVHIATPAGSRRHPASGMTTGNTGGAFAASTTNGSSTLTITSVLSGELHVGDGIAGTGIAPGATITALGTGTGGVGTYTMSANATATGTPTVSASRSAAWAADGEIVEGGALVSHTNGDALQADLVDARYVFVLFKLKAASGGTFKVTIDQVDHFGSFDLANGYHSAPFAQIPTGIGKTYARAALMFDLGARKPLSTVQVIVTSPTNAANTVSVHSVIGLSGDPLAGPLALVCDLSDRGSAGYATGVGSQFAVAAIRRRINLCAGLVGSAGPRIVPIALSTAISPSSDLDVDQFHPNEQGSINGASAISGGILAAAQDWSINRPDLLTQALAASGDGYPLLTSTALSLDVDGSFKRKRLSASGIDCTKPLLSSTSLRMIDDQGTGAYNINYALYWYREPGDAGAAYSGNIGNGPYRLLANGAVQLDMTSTYLRPFTDNAMSCGDNSHGWTYVNSAEYRVGSQKVVGARQGAITNPTGGSVIDVEGRAATVSILTAMRAHGLIS